MPLNYDEYLNASNGTGEAVRSNVVVDRPIGSTEINIDTVLNWPNKFIATSGVLDAATGTLDPDTVTVFFGHINGTYLHIDEFAPGYSDRGNDMNEIVVLKPTTSWADKLAGRVALPTGGTIDQVLTKNSSTAGDASWKGLPNLSTLALDQGLSGTVNGVNLVFTTAANFAAIIIYKNGVTMHVGDDYTITGANQITFVTAPVTGTKLTCSYVTSTATILAGTNSLASDQSVAGLVNGTNPTFTTPQGYIGGTLEVYVNGVKQVRGIHFTETTPGSGIFTMSDAPLTGDVLSTNYQIALTVTGNADTVDSFNANSTPTANTILPLDANAQFADNLIVKKNLCKVTLSANQSATANTWNMLLCNAEIYDTNTMHDNATNNSRIYIKEAGYYDFGATARFSSTVAGGLRIRRFNSANANVRGGVISFENTGRDIINISSMCYMDLGDYLICEAYPVTTTVNITVGAELESDFNFWCSMRGK